MDTRLRTIFEQHEAEDSLRVTAQWRQSLLREFEDGAKLLQAAPHLPKQRDARWLLQAPAPLRKEEHFSIRKHTTCLYAYRHRHSFYELVYVERGSLLHYPGTTTQPQTLPAGGLCLLPPGSAHALEPSTPGDLVLKFIFPIPMFCAAAARLPGGGRAWAEGGILTLPGGAGAKAHAVLQGMTEEYFFSDTRSAAALQAYLSLLLVELQRLPQQNSAPLQGRLDAYIGADPAGATLGGLAAGLRYSAGYLGRRIRTETGAGFSRHLQRHRTRRAAEMLAQTSLTLEEIALALGYANASGLYKAFVAGYNMAPGRYRKLHGAQARPV